MNRLSKIETTFSPPVLMQLKRQKYFAHAVGSRLYLSCLVPSKLSVLWSQISVFLLKGEPLLKCLWRCLYQRQIPYHSIF